MPRKREQADTDELLRRFGHHLRTARIKNGLTQEEMAFRCGLDQGDLSKIENGRQNLTMETMGRLAHVVHVNVRELLRPITATGNIRDEFSD